MVADGSNPHVDDPELASVLYGSHIPTLEGWKAELAKQREEIGRSTNMTSTGNRTWAALVVAQL